MSLHHFHMFRHSIMLMSQANNGTLYFDLLMKAQHNVTARVEKSTGVDRHL